MENTERTKEELLQELQALQIRLEEIEKFRIEGLWMQQKLRESEARYHSLFEDSPISLWEEDFSEVKAHIDVLRTKGIEDFRVYFDNHPEEIANCAGMVKVVDVNKATLKLYHAKSKEELMGNLNRIFAKESYDIFKEELIAITEGRTVFESEAVNQTLTGEKKYIFLRWAVAPGYEKSFAKTIVSIVDITQRKEIEEKLEESERHFRLLAENIKDIIWAMDMELQFKYISPSVRKIRGYTPEETMAQRLEEILTPSSLEKVASTFKQELAIENTGQRDPARRITLELEVIHKNGSIVWTESVVTFLRRPDGVPFGIMGVTRDISERKKFEKMLIESEAKYRALVENSLEGIGISQGDRVIFANKALLDIFGYETLEEFIKVPLLEHVAPEIKGIVKERMEKRNKGEEVSARYEYKIVRKNGEIRDIEISTSEILIGNDKYIQSTFRDITDQKRAEEALYDSIALYRSLVDTSPDAITLTDTDLKIIMVSKRAAKLHGFEKAEEMVGKNALEFIAPEDRERAIENTQKTLKTGSVKNLEYRFLKKDGASFRGELNASVILDKNNNPKAFIGIVRDITERKRAQKELEKLNRELMKSNKKLRQLTLRDPHTDLYNHRYLEEVLEAEFYRARRHAHPLSVIMLDIDYFKSINDVYGHRFGDLVIKQFAKQLRRMVRRYDIVIRFGGEEFVIISPGTDRLTAFTLAQRILEAINLYNFGDRKQILKLKLSVAVVSYPEDKITTGMGLVDIADKILHKVKEDGGNRVYSSMDMKKKKVFIREKEEQSPKVRLLKERIEKLTKQANQNLIEAIFAFAKTIELKDRYTGEHVERTVHYATEIAKAIGLSKDEIEHISQASVLHDLGKIGISEKILLKQSKLTKKEFEEIKKHTQIGADIIRPIRLLHDVIPLILYHHERWDGKGYPNGLKGEEIPVGARIIAIADVYQALISDRPYRKAYTKKKAIEIIKNSAGTQFDPRLVRVFLKILGKEK